MKVSMAANGQTQEAYLQSRAKYRTTSKYRAARKREREETVANGVARRRDLREAASGASARYSINTRARKKSYELALFGDAPEKRVPVRNAGNVVILSDLQIPFEDPGAVEQALTVLDQVQADTVILNGDIVDCYSESAFQKNPKHDQEIPEAHRRVRVLLEALQHVPQKIWMGGNHEDRWKRLLWSQSPTAIYLMRLHQKAEGLDGIDLMNDAESFAKLFRMADYGFSYYPYSHRLYLAEGNLVVTHGKYVSRHSGQSAKRTMEWLGTSCIVGHTHRLGNHLVTQDGVMHGAWENGCLCQLEPEYDDAPNWQQGFSIVKVDGPDFHVIQVPIIRRNGQPVAVYHGGDK